MIDQITSIKIQKDKKSKNKNGVRELKRPIIFICNDAYAKALMPLKEIALQIKIEGSSYDRLLQRLRHICKSENL